MQFDPDIQIHVSGQCPPAESAPPDAIYFRHVMAFPCSDGDFESDVKANKTPSRPKDDCRSWACSLVDSEAAVIALKQRVKKFERVGIFVKLKLEPNHGLVDNDVGHRSFWKASGAKLAHLCEVM